MFFPFALAARPRKITTVYISTMHGRDLPFSVMGDFITSGANTLIQLSGILRAAYAIRLKDPPETSMNP